MAASKIQWPIMGLEPEKNPQIIKEWISLESGMLSYMETTSPAVVKGLEIFSSQKKSSWSFGLLSLTKEKQQGKMLWLSSKEQEELPKSYTNSGKI